MQNLKILNKQCNYIPISKISLIRVNKKNNFNTANIFINKIKNKEKNSFNELSYISQKVNNDFVPSYRIKEAKRIIDIRNPQIDLMNLQMSCNIINHKINQLRNFSKEIDSHSYDNIKNTNNISETKKKFNNRNEFPKKNLNLNYSTYMNNQNNLIQRNKFSNLNLNFTNKKFFNYSNLSLTEENYINNINRINVEGKKKYSFTNFNNHINNINKINKINNIGINNNIIRKKNNNKLYLHNENDKNFFKNYIENKYNETERKIINVPDEIKKEKIEKTSLNTSKNTDNYIHPIYNKMFNKNNIVHKRFNSYGINDFYDINSKSQNLEVKNNINEDLNKLKYLEKKNENKNKNRVGYFDSFFLKNKSLYFIENSCNYNIVNQNSVEKNPKSNYENNFQIQESSKLSFYTSKNDSNINDDNKKNNINSKENKSLYNNNNKIELNSKKIFIPISSNNFCLQGEIPNNFKDINNKDKKEKVSLSNEHIEKENVVEKNEKIIVNNNKEIRIEDNKRAGRLIRDAFKKINAKACEKGNEKLKENLIINDDLKDSLSERDDFLINSEKESINSNLVNKDTTEGKIISSDSEQEKEKDQDSKKRVLIINNKNLNKNKIKEKLKEIKKEKEDSPSKSEEEIFNMLIEKVKQNKEISKKKEQEKKKINNRKVYFDNNKTNYILYDLNNQVTKLMIYDHKGNPKKFNPMRINDYMKKLRYSNTSKYKKLKPNLVNCPKINYKKIIENSNKILIKKNNYNNSKIKKIKISPFSKTNKKEKRKNHIYSLCDNIIKSIDPSSARQLTLKNIKKDNFVFNNNNKKNNCINKNNLINSYELPLKKENKNNIIDLKRKKAKEKILNAIEDIKKYFEEID